METLESALVTAAYIKVWTSKDPILAKVHDMMIQGRRLPNTDEMKPYCKLQSELSLRGSRVIIPSTGRKRVMQELHESHPGICRMKGLARSYVWWPGIDQDLETKVKACKICQFSRPLDRPVQIQPWQWPNKPWSRLHLDYAGPFQGKMFLVIVDAFSKWIEVKIVNTATASPTIKHLWDSFAVHGLPQVASGNR